MKNGFEFVLRVQENLPAVEQSQAFRGKTPGNALVVQELETDDVMVTQVPLMQQGFRPLEVVVEGAAEHKRPRCQRSGQAREIDVFRPVADGPGREAYLVLLQETAAEQPGPDDRRKAVLNHFGGVVSGFVVHEAEIAAESPFAGFGKLFDIIAVDDDVFSRPFRLGNYRFQIVRIEPVVGIQEEDKFSPGGIHPGIPGCRNALILGELYNLQARVPNPFENLSGAVWGAVIHADDFDFPQGLFQGGTDTFFNESAGVVHRDDYGNFYNFNHLHSRLKRHRTISR